MLVAGTVAGKTIAPTPTYLEATSLIYRMAVMANSTSCCIPQGNQSLRLDEERAIESSVRI
jgi:hypothetical protein